jgi:hypothetical protein
MFRRIDLLFSLVQQERQRVEAIATASLQRLANKPNEVRTRPELGILERLMRAPCELECAVDRLKNACYQGEQARLRDACCSLVQVLAAYHPNPDLGWLGVKPNSWTVASHSIQSYVRSRGEVTICRPEASGTLTAMGRQSASLCRPEVLAGIAASLDGVSGLFRRPFESEELIDLLREERRLVLVDLRPRRVYWDGAQVDEDWDLNDKPWELLWALAERAQKGRPLDAEDLATMNRGKNPVKHRRSRLKALLGEVGKGLDNKIKPVVPSGYRLDLKPAELAMLQLTDEFGLVKVGMDMLPPDTGGTAI